MHIASTLAEMKKSTRKRKKDQPPSAEWYKEMRMTLGFRWTKKRDNMLLLAAAKQDHSVPRFAEVADMLDWYPAQELEYVLGSWLMTFAYMGCPTEIGSPI